MSQFRISLPVNLYITCRGAASEQQALELIAKAFEHNQPLGVCASVNMILKRDQYARADVLDAVPTGEPVVMHEVSEEQS